MKKLTLSILTLTLLLAALFCVGSLTASAADGVPCVSAADCTGVYQNGFCSEDATHCQPSEPNGVGANGQPIYEISNAGQLYWFAAMVNGDTSIARDTAQNEKANAVLTSNIDLNPGYTFTLISDSGLAEIRLNGEVVAYLGTGIRGDGSGENSTFDAAASTIGSVYANADDGLYAPIELISGIRAWSPIGSNMYAGSFDGNGKTVGGMFINTSSESQGLFSRNEGTVKRVGVVNFCLIGNSYSGGIAGINDGDLINSYSAGIVVGHESSNYVGGVAGYNDGTVVNSYSTSVVRASFTVGGVVGQNDGEVTDSYSEGAVIVMHSGSNVGGVVGYNEGSVVRSYSAGAVNSDNSGFVGGVIGFNTGSVIGSYSAGAVGHEDSNHVGGVVGYNDGIIESSYNTGDIVGAYTVGGVAGCNYGNVKNCYNSGDISFGENYSPVGGVVGDNYGGIFNSRNEGDIVCGDGCSHVGGVAGYNSGKVANSYNEGSLRVGDNASSVGGVIGLCSYGDLRYSYNSGSINLGKAVESVGGVVGYNTEGDIRYSYNIGTVNVGEGSRSVGGAVGDNFGDVKNVYNTGRVIVGDGSSLVGGVVGQHAEVSDSTLIDTYYLAGVTVCGVGSNPEDRSSAAVKTEAEFKSGAMALLLNSFIGYDVWGQTLAGEQADASPVFLTESNKVYFGYTTCDAAQNAPVFSNFSLASAEKPAHNMEAATCATPSTCAVCGLTEGETLAHAYDNECDADCNACGAERTPAAHIYDNECDADCNECGAERTPAAHVYDNECDTSCNICDTARAASEHLDGNGDFLCDYCSAELPREGLPVGAVIGIAAAGIAVVGIGGFALLWFGIKKKTWAEFLAVFKKK